MTLLLAAFLGGVAVRAQEANPPLPPEEDKNFEATTREYGFNPLQAKKELTVARFYFKKGSYRAAALRAEEALKWDDSLLDAYVMLGEAREKLKDTDGARKAYSHYVELADDSKEKREIQKRLDKLAREDAPAVAN